MTKSSLHRWLDRAGVLLALAPLATAAVILAASDHRWPDLVAQFTSPALLATVVGVVLAILLRFWRTALTGLVGVIALIVAIWPQWFPPAPKALPEAPVITVYSANVWARNTNVEAMAASIASANPDIILLVEVGDAPAAQLDKLLDGYPHRFVSIAGNLTIAPSRGVIASRWPIRPLRENTTDHLSAIGAFVETPLGETGVMSAHLTRPWPYQYQWGQITQVQDMAKIRPDLGQRAIIAGDFNSVSSARIGRQVKLSMDMVPAPAFTGTWPTKLPALAGITIDQVWYSRELALVDRKLGVKNGSDHRPVITRFTAAQSPNE